MSSMKVMSAVLFGHDISDGHDDCAGFNSVGSVVDPQPVGPHLPLTQDKAVPRLRGVWAACDMPGLRFGGLFLILGGSFLSTARFLFGRAGDTTCQHRTHSQNTAKVLARPPSKNPSAGVRSV